MGARHTASCLALSLIVQCATLNAQTSQGTSSQAAERVWASVGIGAGTGSTFAGVIGGWYSRDSFAVGLQLSEVQPFWSADRHNSAALLVGARTSGARVFLVGGLGPATAQFLTDCRSACQLHSVGAPPLALGFSGQAIINAEFLGLSLGTFGALGNRRVSYAGLALSVAAGWFGS